MMTFYGAHLWGAMSFPLHETADMHHLCDCNTDSSHCCYSQPSSSLHAHMALDLQPGNEAEVLPFNGAVKLACA